MRGFLLFRSFYSSASFSHRKPKTQPRRAEQVAIPRSLSSVESQAAATVPRVAALAVVPRPGPSRVERSRTESGRVESSRKSPPLTSRRARSTSVRARVVHHGTCESAEQAAATELNTRASHRRASSQTVEHHPIPALVRDDVSRPVSKTAEKSR